MLFDYIRYTLFFSYSLSHLALWTLLGISLSMLNFTGPVTQQFVSFFVLLAVNTFMPRSVALKTPDKLASGALDLCEETTILRTGRYSVKHLRGLEL